MKKFFFGANWKMYKNKKEAEEYFEKIKNKITKCNEDKEIVFFIPYHLLIPIKEKFKDIKIGAQNFFYKDEGAFTGEISSKMLKEEGIKYAIVGHSERRKIFKEDDELIKEKLKIGISYGLKIVLCIGEDLQEREEKKEYEVIERQLRALDNIENINENNLVIAYEPVWAIGTGKVANSEDAENMHKYIRKLLKNKGLSENIRIIYGGSVNPDNIKDLMKMGNINGALVGGASLNPENFEKIIFFEK